MKFKNTDDVILKYEDVKADFTAVAWIFTSHIEVEHIHVTVFCINIYT